MLEPPTADQVLAKLINYDIYAKEEYLVMFSWQYFALL